jgi:hypothetical protein
MDASVHHWWNGIVTLISIGGRRPITASPATLPEGLKSGMGIRVVNSLRQGVE